MAGQPSVIERFFGYAMIAGGVLIMLLSGGCTLVALYIGLTQKGAASTIGAALILGLPAFAIGFGFFIGGRSLSRRRGPTEPPEQSF